VGGGTEGRYRSIQRYDDYEDRYYLCFIGDVYGVCWLLFSSYSPVTTRN
jgi:hypothetical protein